MSAQPGAARLQFGFHEATWSNMKQLCMNLPSLVQESQQCYTSYPWCNGASCRMASWRSALGDGGCGRLGAKKLALSWWLSLPGRCDGLSKRIQQLPIPNLQTRRWESKKSHLPRSNRAILSKNVSLNMFEPHPKLQMISTLLRYPCASSRRSSSAACTQLFWARRLGV